LSTSGLDFTAEPGRGNAFEKKEGHPQGRPEKVVYIERGEGAFPKLPAPSSALQQRGGGGSRRKTKNGGGETTQLSLTSVSQQGSLNFPLIFDDKKKSVCFL
jgi:hypothetical protein